MNKNTKLARILRRLFGEETGATMMEYVILAVMIAAAVTAAAIYFGNSAKNQMQVANDAMVGSTKDSESRAQDSMTKKDAGITRANEYSSKFKQGEDSDAGAGGGGK